MRLYGTEGGFARREGAPVWRGEVCLFAPAELEAVHLPALVRLLLPAQARYCRAGTEGAALIGAVTVSYTHLDVYKRQLCGEIRAAGDDIHRVETVFFGGGTPSLVPETYIAGALAAAREAFPFAPGAEVSLEANPGTLTMEKLRAYRAMGVNRLSIGVQSFDARLLKDIGRIHTPGEAVEAVRMAKAVSYTHLDVYKRQS